MNTTTGKYTADIEHLGTFDRDEFFGMCGISVLTGKATAGQAYRDRAHINVAHAEGLLEEIEETGRTTAVIEALMDGVTIRLAAAQLCRDLGSLCDDLHARHSQ